MPQSPPGTQWNQKCHGGGSQGPKQKFGRDFSPRCAKSAFKACRVDFGKHPNAFCCARARGKCQTGICKVVRKFRMQMERMMPARLLKGFALPLTLLVGGCVTQVQWQGSAREPARHLFDGAHGVPLAYGGGVCPRSGSHTHPFVPVPAAAFVQGPQGARDTRPRKKYVDTHPFRGRTCFRKGQHWHLQKQAPPPSPTKKNDP